MNTGSHPIHPSEAPGRYIRRKHIRRTTLTMNIQSTTFRKPIHPQQSVQSQPATEATQAPEDSFSFGVSGNDVKAATILGGLGLAGAALGAFAGNYEGAIAGIAGAVVGASAGASVSVHLPGEKIKTGMVLGAVAGAISASSFGGTGAAVAMGVAGATLPYGAIIGLAGALSS